MACKQLKICFSQVVFDRSHDLVSSLAFAAFLVYRYTLRIAAKSMIHSLSPKTFARQCKWLQLVVSCVLQVDLFFDFEALSDPKITGILKDKYTLFI